MIKPIETIRLLKGVLKGPSAGLNVNLSTIAPKIAITTAVMSIASQKSTPSNVIIVHIT